MEVIYEDNHLIAVNKTCREIVQGDKTGDQPLSEMLKAWLKKKYAKPGNVFIGVAHRLDRPVSGVVLFAKTSKALARLNTMFRDGKVKKTYWAIVKNRPPKDEDEVVNWLVRNENQNKSFAFDNERPGAKKAILHYRLVAASDRYFLLEIDLKTGRHHQIRLTPSGGRSRRICRAKIPWRYCVFSPGSPVPSDDSAYFRQEALSSATTMRFFARKPCRRRRRSIFSSGRPVVGDDGAFFCQEGLSSATTMHFFARKLCRSLFISKINLFRLFFALIRLFPLDKACRSALYLPRTFKF